MTGHYERIQEGLRKSPKNWLVTGAAGFIGSHLVESLLALGQHVVGLDNFSTGKRGNLPGPSGSSFRFVEGDIRDAEVCTSVCAGVHYVLHQAALGSVPRSLSDPLTTNDVNVRGFITLLASARDAEVKRFVYASSSSIYGDNSKLPKKEDDIGRQLSPYAVSKYVNELYADVFSRCYNISSIGLRYFNVFGPRQDPNGPYAAVIPKWLDAIYRQGSIRINGDGETSRDFCYVANVVQANVLAATSADPRAANRQFNIACSDQITLNDLYRTLRDEVSQIPWAPSAPEPKYEPFRPGDVRHSRADISAAREILGYEPSHTFRQGISELVKYDQLTRSSAIATIA